MTAVIEVLTKQWFTQEIQVAAGQPLCVIFISIQLRTGQQCCGGIVTQFLIDFGFRLKVFVFIKVVSPERFTEVSIADIRNFAEQSCAGTGQVVSMFPLENATVDVFGNQCSAAQTKVIQSAVVHIQAENGAGIRISVGISSQIASIDSGTRAALAVIVGQQAELHIGIFRSRDTK